MRSRRIIQNSLALFVAVAAVPGDMPAQSASVGYIDEVRGAPTYPGQGCFRKWAITGPREWVSISRGSLEQPASPKDSVMLLDRLRVRRPANVRLRLDSGRFGEGTVYLAPELGKCAEVALRDSGDGSYAISSRRDTWDATESERLVLSIESGSAYVQWTQGSLSVITLGREIRATEAEFAVLADSATNRALLYVHKGVVSMPDAVDLEAVAGKSFLIHREGRPTPFKLNSEFVKDAMYQARGVWMQETHEAGYNAPSGHDGTILAVAVVVVVVAIAVAEFSRELDKQCFPLGCDAFAGGYYAIAPASRASLGMGIVSPGARMKRRP